MARITSNPASSSSSALGFGATLWAAAEPKHVVLGLIFLKYICDAFAERHASLRDALLPELLPGELRVAAAAKSLEASA
jgi:hypothetical protein